MSDSLLLVKHRGVGPGNFCHETYQALKGKMTYALHTQEMKAKLTFSNPFSEARITLRQKPENDMTTRENRKPVSFRSEDEKSSENIEHIESNHG